MPVCWMTQIGDLRGLEMTETGGPLVLYVEDEALILELGVTVLQDAGFKVWAGGDGRARRARRGLEGRRHRY